MKDFCTFRIERTSPKAMTFSGVGSDICFKFKGKYEQHKTASKRKAMVFESFEFTALEKSEAATNRPSDFLNLVYTGLRCLIDDCSQKGIERLSFNISSLEDLCESEQLLILFLAQEMGTTIQNSGGVYSFDIMVMQDSHWKTSLQFVGDLCGLRMLDYILFEC